MTRITRRQLLGALFLGALGLGGLYVYENQYRDLVLSILRDRLSYLDLSRIDLGRFADDYIADKGAYGLRGHVLALAYPVIDEVEGLNPLSQKVETFEYRLVSRFLLSTDFFWNGCNETRALEYLEYNNPYQNPCGNPFAQFD
jgi:hypothetical protein